MPADDRFKRVERYHPDVRGVQWSWRVKRNRDRQRGAALAVSLIAITARLGLGALTVLSVQSEMAAAGQSRFTQAALYAAESGTAAGMDFLRSRCDTSTLFSRFV